MGLAFKRACQWREAEVVYNSAKLAIAQYPQTAAEASVNSATNYVYSLLIRLYRDSKQFEKMQDAFLCAFGACGAVDTFGFDKQQGDELTSPAAANKASGRAWIMTGNTHQIVEYANCLTVDHAKDEPDTLHSKTTSMVTGLVTSPRARRSDLVGPTSSKLVN